MATHPAVTDVDRAAWQLAAIRELDAIVSEHAGLPALAWTIDRAGGLKGQVIDLGHRAGRRAIFNVWQKALGAGGAREQESSGGIAVYLCASVRRGTVRVTITATVFSDDGDEPLAATSGQPAPRLDPPRPGDPRPGTTPRV